MKTLTIKDLSLTEQLDRKAMTAVRGGMKKEEASWVSGYDKYKADLSFSASQLIGQNQSVVNNNGNNVAFLDKSHINSTLTTDQNATNNLTF